MKLVQMNLPVVTIAGFAMAATLISAQAAPLITNGSFEDTTSFVDNTGQDTMTLPVGSTAMPGWTVAGSEALAWIGPANPFSLTASAGNYFLDLTGYNSGGPFSGVTQNITTVPGSTYQLSFDLGSSSIYGLPSAIVGSAAAAAQTFTSTQTGTDNWESETLSFTATGATTTISLIGNTGQNYIGLDNVDVTFISGPPVPEPASLTLLGFSLAGLWFFSRRHGAAPHKAGLRS